MMRHDLYTTVSESQIPLAPSVSVPALLARSIGRSTMMLAGSAMARKTGTVT
jgi:hypothetical protein